MENSKTDMFIEEEKRCNYTIKYVEKTLNEYIDYKLKLDEQISYTFKRLNIDSSNDYVDMIAKTGIQSNMGIKIQNLYKARSKPYFARVDFIEHGKRQAENHYIGKMSLMREENQKVLIIDWRAPAANLYYEERLGESSYICPEGKITGDLLLKRQIIINDGQLESVFDIDITTNDEFLQSHLGANANDRLKEIVSTIQTEQNQIIRADMWKPLIVQGAAGSGKTTIALHRIAYLIYTYEKKFEPENFMILAPTKLFLNYISEILPELGVEKVEQTTFEEIAMRLLRKKFKIVDPNEKLIDYINADTSNHELIKASLNISQIKSSFDFKNTIDLYLKEVEENFIPKKDFMLDDFVIFSYESIQNLFMNDYKRLCFTERIYEIKKHFKTSLKDLKNSIIEKIENSYDLKVNELKELNTEIDNLTRAKIRLLVEQKEKKVLRIEGLAKTIINSYFQEINALKPWEYYQNFLGRTDLLAQVFANTKLLDSFLEITRLHKQKKFIELEDLAPILYIKYIVYGIEEKIPVRHIVIDEAQDFSIFQFYILRNIIKDSSFTILGDICQGIYSYRGTFDWSKLKTYVFNDKNCELMYLEQSYRTTIEIMDVANNVIKKLKNEGFKLAKPVIRHGEAVKFIKSSSEDETVKNIAKQVNEFLAQGFKSIAIICKTMVECETTYAKMKNQVKNIYVLTGKESEYHGGIAVIPVYLSKGLEFDIVFMTDASANIYRADENLEIKLLYVTITRAIHKLYIYYLNELTSLFAEV